MTSVDQMHLRWRVFLGLRDNDGVAWACKGAL